MEKILQLQDLQPGSSYLVRARATNKYGVVSEWSETFKLNVTTDDSPPSTPAAPTVQIAGPQKIVISHDNTKNGGGDLEYDVVSYKVYQNTTNANSGGTLIQTMSATRPGSGLDSFATINVDVKETDPSVTRYFYVTAVDAAGNESQPSPTATGVDITFFESAYISDLTADKIKTGTLQANQQIGVGTVSPIILKSNEASPRGQIYIGGGNYANVDTAFYVDSTGKFSLKNALTWDGETLTIDGYFQIGDEETTISGNQIRTGNLISNNYLRIDPATDTGGLDGIPNNGDPNTQPTGTGDELYTYSGTWFDLDDGSIWAKNFYIDTSGNARFRGNLFASKARFSGEQEDPLDLENEDGVRIPTVSIESTDSDDGYLVFFRDIGRDAGLEFYTKQNDGSSWRRGSLAHLSDPEGTAAGGFLRLGAFRSKTDNTPGRIRIFAEPSISGEQSEIYLDARRTYAQKLFLTQPSTLSDWLNDPVTNFWKDPDGVSDSQDYFKVGQVSGSSISVRRTSSSTSKVKITNYEIEGVATILEDSKVTIDNIGGSSLPRLDRIEIGRDAGEQNRNGIAFVGKNSSGNDIVNNYWTVNDNGGGADFRVGGSGTKYIQYTQSDDTLTVSGNINVLGGNAATTSQLAAKLDSSAFTGINILSAVNGGPLNDLTGNGISIGNNIVSGQVYPRIATLSHLTYSDTGAGFFLGRDTDGQYKFFVGDGTNDSLQWNGSGLIVKGNFRTNDTDKTRISMSTGTTAARLNFFHVSNIGSPTSSQRSGTSESDREASIQIFQGATYNPDTEINDGPLGTIWKFYGPNKSGDYYPPYIAFETNTTASRLRLEVPLDFGSVRIEGKDLDIATETVTFSNVGTVFNGIGTKTVPVGEDYVLGKTSTNNFTLRWFPVSALGGSGGGTTYESGDEDLGIIVDNTNDTILNAGYRKVGNTLGWTNTRGNQRNRITFGGVIPTTNEGRSDGDIHIEF